MARLFIGTPVLPTILAPKLKHLMMREDQPNLRWTPEQQWHVTALFIGTRSDEELPDIAHKAESASRELSAFDLLEGRLCAMPNERPSMLWVRFLPSQQLEQLHRILAEATGTPVSSFSPMWPHITLARGKPVPFHSGEPLVLDRFKVDRLTLFRSDPGPQGTLHSPLHCWQLAQCGAV